MIYKITKHFIDYFNIIVSDYITKIASCILYYFLFINSFFHKIYLTFFLNKFGLCYLAKTKIKLIIISTNF